MSPSPSSSSVRSSSQAIGVGHYENFPVASWLCPPALRPAVAAIYHFARTADDIADEGQAPPEQRLADLLAYRYTLNLCLEGASAIEPRWPAIFGPLSQAVQRHQLPGELLHDLLSAFEQDVRHTANAHRYADLDELLAYSRLSANPVGRLLLHLYGVHDDTALQQSDQICSALQLINFWQDIGVDLPRQRCYLPADVLQRHGVRVSDFALDNPQQAGAMAGVVGELCAHASHLMHQGAPLVHRVPGRAGWELRLVVQGGLRILERIAQAHHRSWQVRVTLRRVDAPRLLWRALRM
ncbi:squalene synthase HpnC [Hydrogenophaga sp. BPS33]|uniref:squalene synthase HpnC n=1 Tax=Hydrogenophaga sp. BPS33 TaxID=2651974 RepID=UPI00132039B1|nr:squalene synthase HpnC [Hydrogenophaga sp. BPS33]QHE86544.1 squalene synthase HpnC [Hydrogenophaga sp. BPS33]